MNIAPTSQYVVRQLQCTFFHGTRQLVTAVDTRLELSKAMEAAAGESAKQEAERQKQEEERIKQDAERRAQQSERNRNMTERERMMEAEAQDHASTF